jgi:hypothetical protein
MARVIIILQFLSGVLLLSFFGWLVGNALGLGKFWKDGRDNNEFENENT